MHDEASPYYVEMSIKQLEATTWKEFWRWRYTSWYGKSTRLAIQIQKPGFWGWVWFWIFVLGRTDYQILLLKNKSRTEWIWEGCIPGKSATLFAGELYGGGGGGYGTWIGYDGDQNQVQDDPRRHDYNVDKLVDQFVQDIKQAAHCHRTTKCGLGWIFNIKTLITGTTI